MPQELGGRAVLDAGGPGEEAQASAGVGCVVYVGDSVTDLLAMLSGNTHASSV